MHIDHTVPPEKEDIHELAREIKRHMDIDNFNLAIASLNTALYVMGREEHYGYLKY